MATLHYMHSDHVDHGVLVEFMAMGLEMQMDHVTAERDAGAIPDEQIADVVYRDLVADPVGVVERLYAGWDLAVDRRSSAPPWRPTWPPATRRAAGGHDYSFADTGPRPGHPPGTGGALPGALRGPVGGLKGPGTRYLGVQSSAVAGRAEAEAGRGGAEAGQRQGRQRQAEDTAGNREGRRRGAHGLEARDSGGAGGRCRPGQGVLRRLRRLPRRRGPPSGRRLPCRPADPAGIRLLHHRS